MLFCFTFMELIFFSDLSDSFSFSLQIRQSLESLRTQFLNFYPLPSLLNLINCLIVLNNSSLLTTSKFLSLTWIIASSLNSRHVHPNLHLLLNISTWLLSWTCAKENFRTSLPKLLHQWYHLNVKSIFPLRLIPLSGFILLLLFPCTP